MHDYARVLNCWRSCQKLVQKEQTMICECKSTWMGVSAAGNTFNHIIRNHSNYERHGTQQTPKISSLGHPPHPSVPKAPNSFKHFAMCMIATSIKGAQRTFHSGFSLLIQIVGRQMVAYSFLWHLCSNLLEQSVFLRKLAFCGRVSAERAALQWAPVLRVCVCVFLSVGILWILMIIPYDNSYYFSYGI